MANIWLRKVDSWSQEEILAAVDDPDWQAFRVSLKGVATEGKLDMLDDYMERASARLSVGEIDKDGYRLECIRVDNYINALKRGGQLDAGSLEVRK